MDDKRQITLTLACSLSGELLPFQVLYEGKTNRCHPSLCFPEGCDIWHTPNHWANGETSVRFVSNIIIPYVVAVRKKLDLHEEHMALVIFDTFKGHKGEELDLLLNKNNIISVIVPPNCTDLLQPLDLAVNKPFKNHLRQSFQSWYSNQVSSQLQEGKKPDEVTIDTRLSIMKPLGVKWITSAYDYIRSQSGIIYGGFVEAGIVEALKETENPEQEDPFKDLD